MRRRTVYQTVGIPLGMAYAKLAIFQNSECWWPKHSGILHGLLEVWAGYKCLEDFFRFCRCDHVGVVRGICPPISCRIDACFGADVLVFVKAGLPSLKIFDFMGNDYRDAHVHSSCRL